MRTSFHTYFTAPENHLFIFWKHTCTT